MTPKRAVATNIGTKMLGYEVLTKSNMIMQAIIEIAE